jgi:hypothetical protein
MHARRLNDDNWRTHSSNRRAGARGGYHAKHTSTPRSYPTLQLSVYQGKSRRALPSTPCPLGAREFDTSSPCHPIHSTSIRIDRLSSHAWKGVISLDRKSMPSLRQRDVVDNHADEVLLKSANAQQGPMAEGLRCVEKRRRRQRRLCDRSPKGAFARNGACATCQRLTISTLLTGEGDGLPVYRP